MTRPLSELAYAPRAPFRRRRWVRRGVGVVVLAALVLFAWVRVPPMWRRGRLLYYQSKCMSYAAPPGQVICDAPLPYAGVAPPFTFSASDPPELTASGLRPPATGVTAGPLSGPVLFMHERTTPHGQRRLVILQRIPPGQWQSWDIPIPFVAHIIDPATMSRDASVRRDWLHEVVPRMFPDDPPPSPRPTTAAAMTATSLPWPPSLKFFAGQPDPKDPSHFTVAFTQNGSAGIIDGWLVDSSGRDPGYAAGEVPIVLLVLREGAEPTPLH